MTNQLYPALYDSASAASEHAQKSYLRTTQAYVGCSISGVALSMIAPIAQWANILSAIFLLGAIGFTVLLSTKQYSKTWYRARALAESIKSASWRFMMHADPFHTTNDEAAHHYKMLLRKLLGEHKDLAQHFGGEGKDDQLTADMLTIRSHEYEGRRRAYCEYRVDDQLRWYSAKAVWNRRVGHRWFILMIVLHAAAVVAALIRIAHPSLSLLPTDLFVVMGASALSWIQLKRFDELAAAYSLTAHEIRIAKDDIVRACSEVAFSKAVADTENAFSREHTQWAARKEQQ